LLPRPARKSLCRRRTYSRVSAFNTRRLSSGAGFGQIPDRLTYRFTEVRRVCGSSRRQRPGARPPHTPQCAQNLSPRFGEPDSATPNVVFSSDFRVMVKEGVSGSSPEEGSKIPAKQIFLLSRLVQQSTSRVRRDSTWWPRPAALCSAKSGSHQGRTGVSNAPTRDSERHAQTRTATRKPA